PAMKRQGGGAIVNVSSISALRPRGLTVYSVSKGAVIALTRAMAVDHGRENIRVNCVAPGPVYTPMVYQRGMTPTARDRPRPSGSRAPAGTSATPCASCSPITRATSPVTRSSSTAGPRSPRRSATRRGIDHMGGPRGGDVMGKTIAELIEDRFGLPTTAGATLPAEGTVA